MPKRPIREKLLATRRHCSPETCLHLSWLIQERFLNSDAYRQSENIGLYCSHLNEVHTDLVARRCLTDGKSLSYPRVRGQALEFVAVTALDEMVSGTFGIPEPTGTHVRPLDEIDLLIVPGVAFDLTGHRLGYGKGCYDRLLTGCRAELERVGFAYEFQVVEQLPAADHDCRLTQLVTEQRMLRFPSTGADGFSNHSRRGGAGC